MSDDWLNEAVERGGVARDATPYLDGVSQGAVRGCVHSGRVALRARIDLCRGQHLVGGRSTQSMSVLAKICHARALFAVRLSQM
jgi:hypothetical protein